MTQTDSVSPEDSPGLLMHASDNYFMECLLCAGVPLETKDTQEAPWTLPEGLQAVGEAFKTESHTVISSWWRNSKMGSGV